MSEPPKYSAHVERQRTRESNVKGRVVGINLDADADWEDMGDRERSARRKRDREEEEEAKDWCCGCFWVGSIPLHWAAYVVF